MADVASNLEPMTGRGGRLIDISLPVTPHMLTWPGDPPVSVRRTSSLSAGDSSNVSELVMGSHTGTHVDAPVHFIDNGYGVEGIPSAALIGDAFVADARGRAGPLGASDLDALGVPAGASRLLIKSDNSDLWREPSPSFPSSYVCLAPDGARWCVDRALALVGVDFLSVEQKGATGHPTHVALLSAGIVIVEGLDLGAVAPGHYELVCLPLRLHGGDGAPARVFLIDRSG